MIAPTAAVGPDASIGPYAILDLLGRGGMGTVYRARQTQPPRDVALKVLSGAHVTPDALRRFEFEAAVLGRLTHPGIAQIFEADLLSAAGGRVLAVRAVVNPDKLS